MSALRDLVEHPALATSADRAAPAPQRLTHGELADLMARFEEAARALQATHESLQGEVRRLESELSDARGRLRRAQDLAALGQMAAGIAHEVRNPLGSIRLYADMLVKDLEDRPDERTLATKVVRAVDSLNSVVNDVLVFSRELRVRPDAVDVRDAFTHAIDACASAIEAKGVRVTVDACEPGDLLADPTLIHQALVNVLRNACEASSDAGPEPRVRLSSRVRTVLNEQGRRTPMRTLRVEDNGPGVPADVLSRMFNPFFTTRHTGTGLGLAIVHRILDAHAGRVDIRSKADDAPGDRGTIVELLVPEPTGPPHSTPTTGDQP